MPENDKKDEAVEIRPPVSLDWGGNGYADFRIKPEEIEETPKILSAPERAQSSDSEQTNPQSQGENASAEKGNTPSKAPESGSPILPNLTSLGKIKQPAAN